MPASAASRRASGVTATPPESRAGPKLRSGVRTSKKGSSLIGCGAPPAWAVGRSGGAAGAGAGRDGELRGASLAGRAGCIWIRSPAAAPPMTPTMAPTGAVSPSCTRISLSTPASVAGTSIDTLSVSISNRLSPGLTASPADLNHLVILPSATVSPSCGMRMFMHRSSAGHSGAEPTGPARRGWPDDRLREAPGIGSHGRRRFCSDGGYGFRTAASRLPE